jgi:hypothetical protein
VSRRLQLGLDAVREREDEVFFCLQEECLKTLGFLNFNFSNFFTLFRFVNDSMAPGQPVQKC